MQNTPYSQPDEKPGMFTALSIITLVSGIINILYSLGMTAAIVLGTLGLGLLCAPFTLAPLVLGIFEILYAVKLLSNPPQPVRPNQTLAILEIVAVISGNVFSAIAGIVALVAYNDASVKAYFDRINSGTYSTPY